MNLKLKMNKDFSLNNYEKIYVLFCFMFCFLWSCVFLNGNYGPDEYMRYDVPWYIFSEGKLPHGSEESIRNPIWGFSYGFGLMLPYLIGAFFMQFAYTFARAGLPLIIAARFVSVLSYTGVVYFAVKIGKKLLSEKTRWIFILFMSLTPQIVFLGSYFNNDIFALFTVMMIIDSWIDCMTSDWDRKSSIKVGLAMGLCFLSYNFAYSYVVGTFILYCLWYAKNHERITLKYFICNGLLISGVVFLVSGWYFIRNYLIYDGDIFALNTSKAYGELYAQEAYKPSKIMNHRRQGYSILGMLHANSWAWFESSLKSMVYNLGYMAYQAPNWVYKGYKFVISIGFILGFIKLFPKKRNEIFSNRILLMISAAISSAITLGISVYYSWAGNRQPQGRYIIYTLPPIIICVAIGYEWLTQKLGGGGYRIYKPSSTLNYWNYCDIFRRVLASCVFDVRRSIFQRTILEVKE